MKVVGYLVQRLVYEMESSNLRTPIPMKFGPPLLGALFVYDNRDDATKAANGAPVAVVEYDDGKAAP